MIKVKLVDCKESVQQWSAMGLDAKVGDVLDRVLGVSTSVKPPRRQEGPQCGSPIEYNGYAYRTARIGDQCWFAENLRTEKYNNGDVIPSNLSDSEWQNTTSGAVAVYLESASSLETYGRLYNWYAVDAARGLCPSGWHVPTDGEWAVMTDFLGGESVAGGKMKATYGWTEHIHLGGNGTNSSGFAGLPGGCRSEAVDFASRGFYGSWWSSSPSESGAWGRTLASRHRASPDEIVYRSKRHRRDGVSVRCIRDAE